MVQGVDAGRAYVYDGGSGGPAAESHVAEPSESRSIRDRRRAGRRREQRPVHRRRHRRAGRVRLGQHARPRLRVQRRRRNARPDPRRTGWRSGVRLRHRAGRRRRRRRAPRRARRRLQALGPRSGRGRCGVRHEHADRASAGRDRGARTRGEPRFRAGARGRIRPHRRRRRGLGRRRPQGEHVPVRRRARLPWIDGQSRQVVRSLESPRPSDGGLFGVSIDVCTGAGRPGRRRRSRPRKRACERSRPGLHVRRADGRAPPRPRVAAAGRRRPLWPERRVPGRRGPGRHRRPRRGRLGREPRRRRRLRVQRRDRGAAQERRLARPAAQRRVRHLGRGRRRPWCGTGPRSRRLPRDGPRALVGPDIHPGTAPGRCLGAAGRALRPHARRAVSQPDRHVGGHALARALARRRRDGRGRGPARQDSTTDRDGAPGGRQPSHRRSDGRTRGG